MKKIITYLFVLASINALAQEYHVSTNGDDGSSGTASQPWETIQHSMDYATPGSTVLIHEGIYNERLYLNVSGSDGNYITFKSATDDEEVIVDGAGMTNNALLEIYNVHHVAIEGIKFMNNIQLDAIGIIIEGACDHIRIEDCDVSNIKFSDDPNAPITDETNAQGIIVYGTEPDHPIVGLEIIDNEIFDCVLGYSEGLAVNGNVDGFIVSENEVHDLTNIGIDIIGHEGVCWLPAWDYARNGIVCDNEVYNCQSPYATSAGIYVDGGSTIIVERNKVYNNQWGIEIGAENPGTSTNEITVRNNFIYNNISAGIACGGYDFPSTGMVLGCTIGNNTLYGNDIENDGTGEIYLSYNQVLTISGNIIYATNSNGVLMSDENLSTPNLNTSIANNLWYHTAGEGNIEWDYAGQYYNSLSELNSATGFGGSSIFSDPLFANIYDAIDLHLILNSPAKDYGNSTYSNHGDLDIDAGDRVAGSSIDLGADEYGSSVGIVEHEKQSLILFPNPAKENIQLGLENGPYSKWEIFDLQGKLVLQNNQPNNFSKKINLEGIKPGIYFVRAWNYNNELFQGGFAKH